MFYASVGMAALWRWTGLETFTVKKTCGGGKIADFCLASTLSAVYAAAVYAVYAYTFAMFASDRMRKAYRLSLEGTGSTLQIQLIRDTSSALLFVGSTAVYWCVAAYRREQIRLYDEQTTVERLLFGTADQRTPPPYNRTVDACCWALYALLAVVLWLDDYAYTMPYTHAAVHAWGHYVLLTGTIQFAVTVFALRRCYRELNGRMRADGEPGTSRRRDVLLDFGGRYEGGGIGSDDSRPVADDDPKTSTEPSAVTPNEPRLLPNVIFVGAVVLDKEKSLTMLKYFTDSHWSITQIVCRINDLFKFRLFVFLLCGLLYLMFTPYLLSLTILNEDIDILPHIIERTLWFVIHIFRVFLMIYPCALLGEEAAKTQILLGSYLNTTMDYVDIKKVETYAQQLDANKPEFSIYSMFVIDRPLVITLTGAVATYLVIILQLPAGQS